MDVAYRCNLDQLQAEVASDRLVKATLLASGRYEVEMPTFASERALFDAALIAAPRQLTPSEALIRELRGA